MTITLHNLAPNPGATTKRKRVGRGPGSGRGKTSTRGQKGQKARSGHHGARVGFEGGQLPMQRRLPKRGFKNPFRVAAYPINLGVLAERFSGGGIVDVDAMRKAGLVPKKAKVIKVLGEGELTCELTVIAHRFSKSAIAKLEASGGTAQKIERGGAAAEAEAPVAEAAATMAEAEAPAEE